MESSMTRNLREKYVVPAGCHLGAGEHSNVTVVLRKSDGKRFACKTTRLVAPDTMERDWERRAMRRFNVEVECLRTMGDHPGVVHYEEIVTDDQAWHLILELCDCSLADLIREKGRMPEKEAALIVRELASTLSDLHAAGIMHRDVKPDNILLLLKSNGDLDCCCKYADFGISYTTHGSPHKQTPLSERVGTPRYVAPEVISGRYGFPADVWSLGATLYHMLAGGGNLFGDYSTSGLLSDIRNCAIEPVDKCLDWTGIPSGARALIRSMMDKSPFKRPKPKEIIKHPWVKQHISSTGTTTTTTTTTTTGSLPLPLPLPLPSTSTSSAAAAPAVAPASSCSATKRMELPVMISIS